MRIPESLASLAEYGIIEEVLRPLMSGKEAQIYLVISGGEQRVAKVYKEAQNRTFKNRAEYTEGRKVRNTRDQRAMGKGSRHGREQVEAAWRATEVEMIYRLRDAGVRVPIPYHFIDSVLVMEMITDAEGNPAPRLGDLTLEPEEAKAIFERLLSEVVRMLSAGVVHGDLSDFNVLVGTDGPVVIDFPQAVDASSNQNARKLLLRDVDNLHRFMARFAPEYRALPYAQEMWQLYERSELAPDAKLTGRHRPSEQKANTLAVLALIGDADYDERKRRQGTGQKMRGVPNAPRPDLGQGREGAGAQAPQRGQARLHHDAGHQNGGHQNAGQQNTGPQSTSAANPRATPRRVEVVMTPETRRAPAGQRQGSAQEPRQREAPLRQQSQRANPAHDSRHRESAPRRHDQRANPVAQDSRQRESAPRQHDQQRANPVAPDGRQRDVPRHQDQRSERMPDHGQRAPAPRDQAAGTSAQSTGTGTEGDGAQRRRRRRRRRKPPLDAPKTPG